MPIRDEVANFLKAFDKRSAQEQQTLTEFERQEQLRNLPVERMRRGEVNPSHLRTFQGQTDTGIYQGPSRFAVPANSDALQEMFKGTDIQVQSIQKRQIRLE